MTALIADDFRENLIIDRLCRAVGLQFGLQTPYRTGVRLQPPRGPTHWAKTAPSASKGRNRKRRAAIDSDREQAETQDQRGVS
jgi:hypothetical protein